MKSTAKLLHQIKDCPEEELPDLDSPDFACPSPAIYMCALLSAHGLEIRDAIRALGLDRSYGYQLFNGTRRPTRALLIRLAALLELDLAETDRLLKICRKESLYPRFREDALAIHVLEKKLGLEKLDSLLEGNYV